MARIRATCPDEELRDPQRAIQDAARAIEIGLGVNDLDTLAAAYAAGGDFEQAGNHAQRALDQASESQKPKFQARLELYKSGRPYVMERNKAAHDVDE